MKTAIHAVTHQATRSVVAICTFEQPTLLDQAARDALRDRLVGDVFPIGISTSGQPVVIPGPDLAIDEIEDTDLELIASSPYLYQVVPKSGTEEAVPGDGKPKKLVLAGNSVTATLSPAGALVVTFTSQPAPLTSAVLHFEGRSPMPSSVIAITPPYTVTFTLGSLTPHAYYSFVLLIDDVPVSAMRLEAK